MATQSPFSLLESFLKGLQPHSMHDAGSTARVGPDFTPPAWAKDEALRRIILLLNHVLMQEPEATSRLLRQKGRTVLVQWRQFELKLRITPAGLLDQAPAEATPDLVLALIQHSPVTIAMAVLRGDKPAVRIEGDVQLAAEINWLADNVRWDIEDDLARAIGDVPARALTQAAAWVADGVRTFASKPPAASSASSTPSATSASSGAPDAHTRASSP